MNFIRFSKREIIDILKGWLGISIAFTILLISTIPNKLTAFLISLLTVGIGFLFHELGHKFVAQRYKCWAEFRSFDQMILFAIVTAFFGIIFAAPGAVMIQGHISIRKFGHIAVAGPIVNYILALIFLGLYFVYPGSLTFYGFVINSWLGLFNMIPFGAFDGKKIIRWNKFYFGLMVGFGIVLLILQQVLVVI